MTEYQKFLRNIEILSEADFYEVLDMFPGIDIDIDLISFDSYSIDQDELSRSIINFILNDYNSVWLDDLDWNEKSFTISDVESIEDLEEIRTKFPDWTISNYDDLIEVLKEEEEEDKKDKEHSSKINLINKVIDNIPIEDLKEFVEKYVD
jgi:hypothetical protein